MSESCYLNQGKDNKIWKRIKENFIVSDVMNVIK